MRGTTVNQSNPATRIFVVDDHPIVPKTVETYRARIKEKLQLKNGTELIQHAVQRVVGKT